MRVSQVLDASLDTCHALRRTPADPRRTHQYVLSVLASGPLTPSPSAFERLAPLANSRGCIMLQEVRTSLWPMSFPVYASIVSFGLRLLYNCNTRYEWLVRPYSPGTFTLEETPSFAWRTNGLAHATSPFRVQAWCPAKYAGQAGRQRRDWRDSIAIIAYSGKPRLRAAAEPLSDWSRVGCIFYQR